MTAELTIPAPRSNGAEVFFKVAFAMGVLVAGLEVGYLIYSPLPYDPVGYLIGRDFVNTWLGGQLALTGDPGAYFGPDAYNALLAERFGPSYPRHIWSYPPPFLLFTWPFGLIPYIPAYVLYTLIGLITYLAVACEGRRPSAQELLLLILAPAVIVNIWCGQTGFFVAALLIGGLISLDRRPILAGVLFGLLSIKPQLGLLLPLMLALTGRWRVIGAAAATIAVLVAVATVAFGPNVWTAYVNDAMPTQGAVVAKNFEHFMAHVHECAGGGLLDAGRDRRADRALGGGGCRGGVDVLARARARSLEHAAGDRHLRGHALCLQLRHGRVRLGCHQADAAQRQRGLGPPADAGGVGDAVPDGAVGNGRGADLGAADARVRRPAGLADLGRGASRQAWNRCRGARGRVACVKLVQLIGRADDRHALGALQIAHPFLEVLGQAFEPLADGLVAEAPRQLAVAFGESAQIGDVVHGASRCAG
jgi:hypothetical protein